MTFSPHSHQAAKVSGPEPERYIALSKVKEIVKRIMDESKDLTADSEDYRIGQWSGAEKVGFAIDCHITVHGSAFPSDRNATMDSPSIPSQFSASSEARPSNTPDEPFHGETHQRRVALRDGSGGGVSRDDREERLPPLSSPCVEKSPDLLVQDLAMTVRRLCRKIELYTNEPIMLASAKASREFLKRKGLEGSPLRDEAYAQAQVPAEKTP